MKRLFFLFAVAIVATGAMAQGPQGSRGHHNDHTILRHMVGVDGQKGINCIINSDWLVYEIYA